MVMRAKNPAPAKPSPERGGEGVGDRVGAVPADVPLPGSRALEVGKEEGKERGEGSALDPRLLRWEKAFLTIAPQFWPNVSAICKRLHITRPLFNMSLQRHPWFAKAVAELDLSVTDAIEGLTANLAMVPKHVIDRMAYLRAHRPELYDRAKRVVVEGYRMTPEQGAQRLAGVEAAVDAEIVKAYTDRKERQRLKAGGGAGA